MLEKLSARVELSQVGEILRLYCKALTGTNVCIQTVESLAEKGIGWVGEHRAEHRGHAPSSCRSSWRSSTRRTRTSPRYKVFATHQAAHIEFGSFDFRFDRAGVLLGAPPGRRAAAARVRRAAGPRARPPTDMERFFDLFPERQLACDLFTIAEDSRIDWLVKREYGGIRKRLAACSRNELRVGRMSDDMPLRKAFVENLVRASLDGVDRSSGRRSCRGHWLVRRAAASRPVQEAAPWSKTPPRRRSRLYEIAISIPNV